MTRWRFLDCGPASGRRHMAIDEALLEAVARGYSPPLFRLFAFTPVCLSLGRFQATHRQLNPSALAGIDVVRRPTGGRAVLHAGDLCYAVVAPIQDPVVGGSIYHSYCRIALAFTRALELLGARVEPPDREYGTRVSFLRSSSPSACFAAFGPSELAVAGVKVVGSAQVRRDGAFLQQGSLRLQADPEGEARLLGHSQPSLSRLLGRTITYQEAAAALRQAFTEALGITFQDSSLTQEEQAIAEKLEREKYANPTWAWQR